MNQDFNNYNQNNNTNNQPMNNNINVNNQYQQPLYTQSTPQPTPIPQQPTQNNYNVNAQPTNNTPKKKSNIGLIIGIVVAVVVIAVIIVLVMSGNNKKVESNNNGINTNNNTSTNDSSRKIKSADLDLYNSITDSNYLSVVLYDPLKDRQQPGDKSNYDKSVVITYDLGENVKDSFINNGFKTVASESNSASLKYYFGLTNNKYVLYQATATTTLKDGSSWLGIVTKQDGDITYFKDDSRNNLLTQNKNYKNDYAVYGDNWYATNYQESEINQINIKLGESSDKDIFALVQLNTPVSYNNSFVDTVNNMVKNNEFKNTLTILNNTDDVTSVVNSYGKKIELNKTIFYQDLVSTIISNEYGLNLKNKDYFTSTDTMYIKYKAYTEDDYLTEIVFEYPNDDYEYDYAKQTATKDQFEYSYNNIKYSYFVDYKTVYVYKNEKFVGKITITHKNKVPEDMFAELSYLFGTRK